MMTTAMAIDPSKHAGLEHVGDFPFAVFASTDVVPRACDIAERGARALRFLGSALDVEPELALLVLAPDDWEGRASHPVYGMPNYDGAGNLVVAGAASDFWRGFVGLVAETQPDALAMLTEAYEVDGEIDLSPFFDLLAIHEMGHRLHQVGVVRFPRLWLAEFFCNLCLHTYVAEEEPEALDVLEAFPAAVAAVPPEHMVHDDLGTFEQIYDRMPPHNYGWYQCRLHAAAKRVYDAGGPVVLRRLWNRFRLSDAELIVALHEVEPELGRFLTEWTPTGRATAEP
jgi:hypothetical protein